MLCCLSLAQINLLVIFISANRDAWNDNLWYSRAESYDPVIRRSPRKNARRGITAVVPRYLCKPKGFIPDFLYVIAFSWNIHCGVWILIWRVYHPQTCGRTQRNAYSGPWTGGSTKRVSAGTSGRLRRPASAAAALPLFLSGRSFTIGNLHKRLTEAKLNHTREREKNRKASEVFVRGGARIRVPGPGGEGRGKREEGGSRKEKRRGEAGAGRGRRRREQRKDEEGARALADGGESLRRVARRSYRRYHGGSALSSKSVSSPPVFSLSFVSPTNPSGTPT